VEKKEDKEEDVEEEEESQHNFCNTYVASTLRNQKEM